MMGGDFAPLEAVKGVKQYLSNSEHNIFCIGEETQLKSLFQEHGVSSPFLHIVHASQVVGYHEHPTKALKEKPDSSISVGFKLLAEGTIDAFGSAGNTPGTSGVTSFPLESQLPLSKTCVVLDKS